MLPEAHHAPEVWEAEPLGGVRFRLVRRAAPESEPVPLAKPALFGSLALFAALALGVIAADPALAADVLQTTERVFMALIGGVFGFWIRSSSGPG